MARLVAFTWGLGLVLAAAAPVLRSPEHDAFPFSTYPMFAHRRERPTLHFAEAVTADRQRLPIAPELVASGPVMQASQTLAQAEARGSLAALCERIALAIKGKPELAQVRRVQLVRARFDPIRYFEVGPEQADRRVLQRCRVPGAP